MGFSFFTLFSDRKKLFAKLNRFQDTDEDTFAVRWVIKHLKMNWLIMVCRLNLAVLVKVLLEYSYTCSFTYGLRLFSLSNSRVE